MAIGQNLNNIWQTSWDYINNVAKNFSRQGVEQAWKTYMVQSPDELANVARNSMHRKNTLVSNLDFDKLNSLNIDMDNQDYVAEFNNLKSKLNVLNENNIDEAKTIAETISNRFDDDRFLQLLNEAEGKHSSIKQQISGADSNIIKSKYENDAIKGLSENKIAQTFTTSKQQRKIAESAYKVQGLKGYFNSGDAKTNQIRAGVVGGAYMGGSMVVRGLQGGNPITNEYGERDIAGIPFI